jgi:hypothetical protein
LRLLACGGVLVWSCDDAGPSNVPRRSLYIARATADLRGTRVLYENVDVYAYLQGNIDLSYVMNVADLVGSSLPNAHCLSVSPQFVPLGLKGPSTY